jgi:hypothetical protein
MNRKHPLYPHLIRQPDGWYSYRSKHDRIGPFPSLPDAETAVSLQPHTVAMADDAIDNLLERIGSCLKNKTPINNN